MRVLQEGNGDVSGLLWIPKVHFHVHISLSLTLSYVWSISSFIIPLLQMQFVHLTVYSESPVGY